MKDAPLVSVIVPMYNNEAYVGEAIESALHQDYPAMEIIVVDDGSKDRSAAVVESFGDRVKLIQQSNQGAASARNRALSEARGEYIAFLDSDDLWLPGKIRAQVDHLEANPDVGLVYCAWTVWEPDDRNTFVQPRGLRPGERPEGIDPDRSGWLYNDLLLDCIIHTTTAVLRRSVVERVGLFDIALKRGQDYDYWLRVSRVTKIHKLRAVLSLYRIHELGVTAQPQDTNYGIVALTKALERWGRTGPNGRVTSRGTMRKVLGRVWFGFGYSHLHRGDPFLARHAFRKCLRYRPLWLPAWINLWRAGSACRNKESSGS